MAEDRPTSPDVSVVIPCYNSELWVGRAIDSVLAQDGVSVEVIVIDDGSTDRSLDVLRTYGERIQWKTGPNNGACSARNRGLELARADYVMFLDADDFISPDLLASMWQVLNTNAAQCCFGKVLDGSESGVTTARALPRTEGWRALLHDWLMGRFLPPCGILWRRDFIQRIGGWDTALKKNQDGHLMYRAILEDATFVCAENGHAVYWHHSGDRISSETTPEKLRDSFNTLKDLTETLKERGALDTRLRRAISHSAHALERKCAQIRDRTLAKEIREFRKSFGFPRYDGTMLHVAASSILGLEQKERISGLWHAAKSRTRGQ